MKITVLVLLLCLLKQNLAFLCTENFSLDSKTACIPSWNPAQFRCSVKRSALYSSTLRDDDMDGERRTRRNNFEGPTNYLPSSEESLLQRVINGMPFVEIFKPEGYKKLPPMQIEDMNVLFYDVFLLLNLVVSISFWVTHRMSLEYIPSAFSEGCLLSILWIGAGLYHGSFLMSSVDGHYGSVDERGGPKAAAALALNTFVNAINLRLVFALAVAFFQHRQVGTDPAEQLLPLEIGFGLILMTSWRALHSYITPRF